MNSDARRATPLHPDGSTAGDGRDVSIFQVTLSFIGLLQHVRERNISA
jgi:hypothetical protein